MPYNSNTGIVSIDTSTTPHQGVSIYDVQRALGRGTRDVGLLCSDREWYDNNGTQALRFVNKINKMAKYKPVAHSKKGMLTEAERQSVRYGHSAPTSFYPNTYISSPGNMSTPPAWTYTPPTNTPFRMTDFVKDLNISTTGYYSKAVPPMIMELGALPISRMTAALLWIDESVNTYYAPTMTAPWVNDANLSIQELLHYGSNVDYYDMWVAFCFFRYNAAGTAIDSVNLVVTNQKFEDVPSTGNPGIFRFYPQGGSDAGLTYPVIPLLNTNDSHNRKFLVVACVTNGGMSTSDALTCGYKVYEGNNANYECYSLGFDANRLTDRVEVTAKNAGAIDELTGTLLAGSLVLTKIGQSGDWYIYQIKNFASNPVQGSIATSPSYQSTSLCSIEVGVTVPNGAINGVPGSSTAIGYQTFTQDNVSFAEASHTYTRNLITSSSIDDNGASLGTFYLYKDDPNKKIIITAQFQQNDTVPTRTKDFANVLTIVPE